LRTTAGFAAPAAFQEEVFRKFFDLAEIAHLDREDARKVLGLD
jgi:hypothetical protein